MKILQLLPELNVGGIERGTVDLCRVLIARGHEAHVISAGGSLVPELEKMGARHLALPIHKKSLATLGLVKKLVHYIEENGIEIIHARSRVPAWIGYLACRYTDADFITTCHGYYSKHFFSRVMGWGKRVIVISNVIGRRMMDDFGVSTDRIRLISRGVDLKFFPYSPLAQRFPKKGEPFRIVNVGRITPLKGHKDFIRALHWLKQKGRLFEALIVGSAPPSKAQYFAEVEQLVEKLELKDRLKFLGNRTDVPQLIRDSHILVLTTKTPEAFGRVVAEAGAVGTAVVATQVGGVTDIVRDKIDGRLVPPGNPERLAETLCEVVDKREETIRYSESLQARVRENFGLDQMFAKTLQVYHEVRDEKRILVVKLGALGDVVLISPSLRLLRHRYPKAHIALLVDERFYEVAVRLPYLDEVIVYDRKKSQGALHRYLKLAKKIREKCFDVSIDFQNTPKTHLLSYLAGIPKRFGYQRGFLGFILTGGQPGFRDKLAPIPHQFRILRGLGLGVGWSDDTLELKSSAAAQARTQELFLGEGFDLSKKKKLLVGFSLSASPVWTSKNWPLDSYVQLGEMVLKNYPASIVLFGAKDETEKANLFKSHFPAGDVIDLVGKTTIGEMLDVIRELDLLVGPDSAPLHVASAFQVSLIGLFGSTDSRRHAPPGEQKAIFQKSLSCSPCYKRECVLKTGECMQIIQPEEVFSSIKKFLDSANLSVKTGKQETAAVLKD